MLATNVAALAEEVWLYDEPQDAPEVVEDEIQHGLPRFTRPTVLLYISARIMEEDRVETWNESLRKVTMPGRPVELKLVGTNVVVVVQFTPYMRRCGARKTMVAQGQIWMNTPRGISYHASMQTIQMEFGETIYFFPLGPVREGTSSIEVILTVYPYEDED